MAKKGPFERRIKSNAMLRSSGLLRRRTFGGSSANPAPIVCLWPLDASNAECVSAGYAGRVPATDATYQSFQYVTSSSESTASRLIAPADFGTTHVNLPSSGKWVVEIPISAAISETESGFVDIRLILNGTHNLLLGTYATAGAGGDLYGGGTLSGRISDRLALWVDADTGDYKIYQDGTLVVESYFTIGNYTNPYLAIRVQSNSIAENGGTVDIDIVTSPTDLTGTYPAGTKTLCGDTI